MKEYIAHFFKGFGMGAANVIPGVSGGTVALITGIFERLIDALKSFNLTAVKLLLKFKIKDFIKYTDFYFLVAIFLGVGVSILSLAKLLEFLFTKYEVLVWAFFFGLILASVYFVGKTITKWNFTVVLFFIIGTAVAASISFLSPATENDALWYLILCGVAGVCSMILPGLSGSFILILMGNYQLVMIRSVNEMNFSILIPVGIGVIIGLIAFSHILSWIFKKYKNQTIAVLTGFILGSLGILWPWKEKIPLVKNGHEVFDEHGEIVIKGYQHYFPEELNGEFIFAVGLIILGIAIIWVIEKLAAKNQHEKAENL